jgi:hypothetical protein
MKFITFENMEQVNERLKSVDLNKLTENLSRTEYGLYVFDSIGLQLFVSEILRQTFYKPE